MIKNLFFLLLFFAISNSSWGQSHKFKEAIYSVVFDEYCYKDEGFLKISEVTDSTFRVTIKVSNGEFEGSLDCIASIDGYSVYAEYNEDLKYDKAKFEFWLSPDRKFLFVDYNGPAFEYSGMGVCLKGYYKLN